jgi:4-hydroxybenzoate polyprenyltransferase
MFRQYLLLVRAPNLFTVPSNILAGYFAVVPVGVTDIGALLLLVVSSIFLYISGIILNDYFDIEVDRKERPNRPLASGRIEKRTALVIAVISIIIGNILALVVSLTALAVSALLTYVIIAYNYRLKHNAIGNPLTMGLARFLNVVLGGSTALGPVIITQQDYTLLVFIGYCLFLYTAAISILSRIEIASTKISFTRSSWIPIFLSFSIVSFTIVLIVTVGLLGYFQIWFIFNLIIFSCIMAVTFLQLIMKVRKLTTMSAEIGHGKENDIKLTEERAQNNSFSKATREIQLTIKTMILSIIVLDSVFLSGLVGIPAGMAILLLVIPPILLGRRLYVT